MGYRINQLTVAKILSIIVIAVGIAVTFGWIFDIVILKSIFPNYVTMKFSSSICFIFSGITLYFIARFKEGKGAIAHVAVPTSGLVIFLFMGTFLISNFISFQTGIESIFVKESGKVIATTIPGRPSIATMVNFILIIAYGIFSMSNSVKLRKSAVWIGYIVTGIGSVSLVGYVTNLPLLYYASPGISTAMAIHTGVLFVILGSIMILLRSYYQEVSIESLKIGKKLVSLFLIASITPIIFVGSLFYGITKQSVSADSFGVSIFIVGAISAITIGIFSISISRSIINPILKIKAVASQISTGHLDLQADENSKDELGDLAKAFNQMTNRIKQNEETKIKNEKLISIGELTSRLAHDLRNPLSVIKSSLNILKLRNPNMDEKSLENLNRLDRAVSRMTHQIDDVLDYVKPKPLALIDSSLLEILHSSLERMITSDDVIIRLPKYDIKLVCDNEKMEVVFVNLISNAAQAMNNKGEIIIDATETQDQILIEVKDNGPGIPDRIIPKIFDPLFTTRQIGTGLGLVSCKSIVEKHGGKIEVKTEIGKGTTFIIKLPKSKLD
ncbi:MAG TPA: HAMP domain-containing sensor histidine kinase [Nitrosopumilaceae archaeon]|nr:HAMP domain-containing sensor histidine kinase [Nitrosopumilaceae archaeon]